MTRRCPTECTALIGLERSECSLACPLLAEQVSWHLRHGDAEAARLMAATIVESYIALTALGTTEEAVAKLRELRRQVRPMLGSGCEWGPKCEGGG